MPSNFRHIALVCVSTLILASPAFAETVSEGRRITLRDALNLTIAHSPRLGAHLPAREAAEKRAAVNALAPPMSIELQLENFAGIGAASGVDALEATLQLSRVIELGGKAGLRRATGDADLARLELQQRAQRIDLLADVSRRFIHVLADQEQLEAARRSVGLAEAAVAAVRARVNAGAASPAAQSRAEIALARATIEREHAEHELASSRVALAIAWGEERAAFDSATGSFFAFAALESLERYTERLAQSPELLLFASEQRLMDARARLATAQRTPSPVVSLGVRRLEAFDDQALVAGFSMPLGTRKRSSLELDSVTAEKREAELSHEARRLELIATLYGLYQEVLHARTEAEAIAQHIRPQAARMLKISDDGYRAGRFSLIELADAQRQMLEIEQDEIRAAAQFHTNLIEIERLTGIPVELAEDGKSP